MATVKITRGQLRRIVSEEAQRSLREMSSTNVTTSLIDKVIELLQPVHDALLELMDTAAEHEASAADDGGSDVALVAQTGAADIDALIVQLKDLADDASESDWTV